MTRAFSQSYLARAAKVVADTGVSVTLETSDGRKITVAPVASPPESPQDKQAPEPWN